MRVSSSCSAVVLALCLGISTPSPAAPSATEKVIARIDLSKRFDLPSGASFTATQGPPVEDPATEGQVPGPINLCIRLARRAPCSLNLNRELTLPAGPDLFSTIHFLETSEIVYPRSFARLPLLHLQFSSFPSTDGGQRRAAAIIAYVPTQHRFMVIFDQMIGSNGNEEARYVRSGPLKGDMITAEPTSNAPFGYWITVNRLTRGYRYRQVLRYRSATRYGDGNRLAVIDSEMPNILRRLGLWHSGDPLPLPKSGCAHPRLVKGELWCSPPSAS